MPMYFGNAILGTTGYLTVWLSCKSFLQMFFRTLHAAYNKGISLSSTLATTMGKGTLNTFIALITDFA